MTNRTLRWGTIAWMAAACAVVNAEPLPSGKITIYDPAMSQVIAEDAAFDKLADGFTWSEGPVWVRSDNYLLFTDVPENTMYRWSEKDGASVFLKPSGYAGPPREELREGGANGLYPAGPNSILLADSGNRNVAELDLTTKQRKVIADEYRGKKFNSPNDLVRSSNGTLYFTDPPYGLKDLNDSPIKELKFNAVYRVETDGSLHVIDDGLSFPNGIALSPDERTLYVANSDPDRPIWMAYQLDERGQAVDKRVFADASDLRTGDTPGLPDGMAVAATGHIFATGPGGVIVFAPDGKRLGRIETGTAIANCAFGGDDGKTLFLTSHRMLVRVPTLVQGLGFTELP